MDTKYRVSNQVSATRVVIIGLPFTEAWTSKYLDTCRHMSQEWKEL